MNKNIQMPLVLLAGIIAGAFITQYFLIDDDRAVQSVEEQPLYWVAPMDDNYRRDKAGLSPMGMELVPVYKNASESDGSGVGTIKISPDVINNLGVRTEAAKVLKMETEIKTVGVVQYDQDKLIHIHPRVEGWVEKLFVKTTGAPVKKGQALYALYSPELVNAQQEYIAELNRNNAGLIAAAEQRLSALNISPQVIQQLKRFKEVKQTVTFYAPQAGVIGNLNIREGFFVKPGTTMMSIGALDKVWVEAEIFERQASVVKVGQSVSMTLDFLPGKIWSGKVDYIYPALDATNRTLRARLRFDNKDLALKPNMFAQINIHTSANKKSLLIPKEAVIRSGDHDRVVLDLGMGQFKSVEVIIGAISDQYIEVLKGLSEGERVVTSAQFLLDSESSKQSDFKRMSHPLTLPSATVYGIVNSIKGKQVNISRGPIEKWDRPATTMDFTTLPQLATNLLTKGAKIEFTFEIDDGNFIITQVRPATKKMILDIQIKAEEVIHTDTQMEHDMETMHP